MPKVKLGDIKEVQAWALVILSWVPRKEGLVKC